MHARKNTRTFENLLERISAHAENHLTSQADDRPTINLGNPQQQLIVSLESFFDFNFELSKDLEMMVEGKLLSENQKEWNQRFRGELRYDIVTCQPLVSKTGENRNVIPRTPK